MHETRLESVLALRAGVLPAPLAAWVVARVAELIHEHPRTIAVSDVRVRADGKVRLVGRDGPAPLAARAPEIAGDGVGDGRAAVFSLGVMLVHISLGYSPFERPTPVETRLSVGADPVPALRGRAAHATAALDRIVEGATAKAPEQRHTSPLDLRDALERYFDDELHEVSEAHLAAAVREAIQKHPSDDRTSMPDFGEAELTLRGEKEPRAQRAAQGPEPSVVHFSDPAELQLELRGAGSLQLDDDAVRRARARRATGILEHPPPQTNWPRRVGLALLLLLGAAILYGLVLRPLLSDWT